MWGGGVLLKWNYGSEGTNDVNSIDLSLEEKCGSSEKKFLF
jgi:hypothetical protein